MRSLFAAAVAALALAGGASLPADAYSGAVLREGAAGDRSLQLGREGLDGGRLHLARAHADDDDDEDARPVRRWRSDSRWDRPRHARPRHTRSARHVRSQRQAQRQAQRQVQRRAAKRTARTSVRAAPRAAALDPVSAAIGGITGMASFYWQGQRTATGERFNPEGMTAAHRSLPFGTRVRVTHLGNGRTVDVRINDRGPFIGGRVIDLSRGAAGVLGMHHQGVARVKVTVLGR
jgi:peptidoglycan lytic transglycosylase